MSEWTCLFPTAKVPAGGAASSKVDGRQVAIFHTVDGEWFAVDNQCPHEGYPLVQGYVRDCVLTCAWHNFKFDLRDGHCVKGDEDLPTWELRLHEGHVEVRPRERVLDKDRAFESLHRGVLDHDPFRSARDVHRLMLGGVSPLEIAFRAAQWDSDHGEYGCGHGLAVAADAIDLIERRPDLDPALPLVQALDIAGEAIVRRPVRPLAEPASHSGTVDEVGEQIQLAIEEEEAGRAESLWLGVIDQVDVGRAESWLFDAISRHFLGFGHPLIYATKAFALIDRVGWDRGRAVLPGLLHRVVTATREDTLPPMRRVRRLVDELEEGDRLRSLWGMSSLTKGAITAPDAALVDVILDGSVEQWTESVLDALNERRLGGVLASLVEAAAVRLLRFDHEIDADPEVQDGWLDVTHGLTYSIALMEAIDRVPRPFQLRHVFWAAHFIHRTRSLDRADGMDATGLDSSIEQLEDLALGDGLVRPIVVAHAIKTVVAAGAWSRRGGGDWPLRAAARLIRSPIRERSLGRAVYEARRLVVDGKAPRSLSFG